MNLIRKLKISEVVDIKFTESESNIIKKFDFYNSLIIFVDDWNPKHINYMNNNGKCIIQYDIYNDTIFYIDNKYGDINDIKYVLDYDKYVKLIKYMLFKILHIKGRNLFWGMNNQEFYIEERYKLLKNEYNKKV